MITNSSDNLLVSPEELATLLDREDLVIVDCRFNLMDPGAGRQAWEAGHIKGAFYADLDQDLAAPITETSGRHPLPEPAAFAVLLGSWGLTPDKRVIAYDSAGGAIAARLWWLLRWAGHKQVALLDGGYPAWEVLGLPVSSAAPELSAGRYPVVAESMPVISVEAVEQSLQDDSLLLTDARDAKRFAGSSEPIDTLAGHVPGALNLPFQDCLDKDGRFRSPAELEQLFGQRLKADGTRPIACMCGSGVTACHTIFCMELAGLMRDVGRIPALYVGSWSEWIRSGERRFVAGQS